MSNELKPCPFCGGDASIENDFGRTFWVQCNDLESCGATDGMEWTTPAEAIAAWNRRASNPAPVELSAPLTDSYVQTVPDKCDRIVWRGCYYHLPVASQAAPDQRTRFETAHCGGNKHTCRRNEHGDYVLPSVQDAWAGWQSCSSQTAPVTVPVEVRGGIARKIQEQNRHIDIQTARYYVDAVCDLLAAAPAHRQRAQQNDRAGHA